MSYSQGAAGSPYTALSPLHGTSDGSRAEAYGVGTQAQSIRDRLESSSPLSTFTVREILSEYAPRGL